MHFPGVSCNENTMGAETVNKEFKCQVCRFCKLVDNVLLAWMCCSLILVLVGR